MSERPVGNWSEFFSQFEKTWAVFKAERQQMLSEATSPNGKVTDVPDRDKYFHCMANCLGNSMGAGGEVASAAISSVKELHDVIKYTFCKDWSFAAASRDSSRDQAANRIGRDAGRSGLRCEDACRADHLLHIKSMYL
jgi:hypothetical protein